MIVIVATRYLLITYELNKPRITTSNLLYDPNQSGYNPALPFDAEFSPIRIILNH